MDRSDAPPLYSNPPSYEIGDDEDVMLGGQGPPGSHMRLLTSTEEPEPRLYVPSEPVLPASAQWPWKKNYLAPYAATGSSSSQGREEAVPTCKVQGPREYRERPILESIPDEAPPPTSPILNEAPLPRSPLVGPFLRAHAPPVQSPLEKSFLRAYAPPPRSPLERPALRDPAPPPRSPLKRPALRAHTNPLASQYDIRSDIQVNISPRNAYQPSVFSTHSRAPSIIDTAPSMPPPQESYVSYDPSGRASPTRPWTPLTTSAEMGRPPPAMNYEPADLNGRSRPGSPSSRYGGSPRRPLPPAPLFAGGNGSRSSFFADDATVSIPLGDDDDDVFGPATGTTEDSRPGLSHTESYTTQDTLAEENEEKEQSDRHEPAPDGKQERRGARKAQMTKKEVRLVNGALILECKIPTTLFSFLPRRDEQEFTHMRYTAVTCDPDHFVDKGYLLRQNKLGRETELFICVTMYNENEIDFTRTMHAVMKNISHFCSRSKSRTWGENGWQKIVVAIISDGRQKIHPRTLDVLAAMGVYQDGIAKNIVNQEEVQAHVYEYTTQVSLDADLKFKGAEKGIVPCQMLFCLKEKNAKKLNSHRWFFNAFGRSLSPNICILLDVGTKPTSTSLYHLWKAFDTDSNVAGACGEIKAMKGKGWVGLLNPLVASQNFEYKMSNILDKPLESVFGYITVLPGALSAYRYYALQNDATGHGPLSQYFKGESMHGQDADVFTANMYLAEDRILCWELVAKRDEKWVLKYVKSCTGETDVPGKCLNCCPGS